MDDILRFLYVTKNQYNRHILTSCLYILYKVLKRSRTNSNIVLVNDFKQNVDFAGYAWMDITLCVQWMASYAMTLREAGQVELKFFQGVASADTHNIQTHTVDLQLLVSVLFMKSELL